MKHKTKTNDEPGAEKKEKKELDLMHGRPFVLSYFEDVRI